MSHLESRIPIKVVRMGKNCADCGQDNMIEIDVCTLSAGGVETVATLKGCVTCKTGLCREDPS